MNIHFIHVKSPHENALPLIMTHRLARLGHRAARGRWPADGPGRARRGGWGRVRPGAAVAARLRLLRRARRGRLGPRPHRVGLGEPTRRLGYTRYVAQGGDVGAIITDMMGRRRLGLAGIDSELARDGAGRRRPATGSEQERAAVARSPTFSATGFGYFWSRPRGRRRSATPCWILPSLGGLDARPRHRPLLEHLLRLYRRGADRGG